MRESQMQSFQIAQTPVLHFGAGKVSVLAKSIKRYGTKVLLVTGGKSFSLSPLRDRILQQLEDENIRVEQYRIIGEPSPLMIDDAVRRFSDLNPQVVVAIGGGSALDAGKAISAMLPLNEPVKDYLEGVGTKVHPGKKLPFIAVPTTAGTGSEATKNSVLSETGEQGYKRSLRHNNFVPDEAIVDPELTLSCSPTTTAASGMDAFTQLLESYLSTAANPITDVLALEGLTCVSKSLLKAYQDGSNMEARTDMALAAYLSGIALANAGLGLVHGFASSIGGYLDIPHGVICSALMAPANKHTVEKLRRENPSSPALAKYAKVGRLFAGHVNKSDPFYVDSLLDIITSYSAEMKIPSLNIPSTSINKIVSITDNKNNPTLLSSEEIEGVLRMTV